MQRKARFKDKIDDNKHCSLQESTKLPISSDQTQRDGLFHCEQNKKTMNARATSWK